MLFTPAQVVSMLREPRLKVFYSPPSQDLKLIIIHCIILCIPAQVVSMLREPRLKVFYSPPSQDLKLNFDMEEELEKLEFQRPWPDLEFIFDNDPEYQRMLGEIGHYMSLELERVKQYSAVSCCYILQI